MSAWKQWVRQPQRLWLRRALFQIHLWTGLAIGLYIVMLSVTGSALVYRRELAIKAMARPWVVIASGHRLSEGGLTQAARKVYPEHIVTRIGTPRNPHLAVEVALQKDGTKIDRLFDPYTGEDLGAAIPAGVHVINWLASLHDDLLFAETGRRINGVGSILVTLLCVTGAIIWWPGVRSWRRSVTINRKASWPRLNWDLHSALGFWCFAFVLLWAVSGIYLGFPGRFEALADYIQPIDDAHPYPRPSDIFTMWLTRLHFGRFRETPSLQAVWALAGLVPAVMFVTGSVMWWNRVLRKVRLSAFAEASADKKPDTTYDSRDSAREQPFDDVSTGREHFANL